jgi:hypothetical protein|tara:strand:- start:1733 stop:1960 length:228 start_codon:yes stop_codon:yes gene_type:complete
MFLVDGKECVNQKVRRGVLLRGQRNNIVIQESGQEEVFLGELECRLKRKKRRNPLNVLDVGSLFPVLRSGQNFAV